MKPLLRGKVRPIINNLQLQAGNKYYDVICNVKRNYILAQKLL